MGSMKCDQEPIVKSEVGVIRGMRAQDGNYDMFLGVPYGKVQEDNPFGLAVPYPKFEGIFNANDDSAISPQEEEFTNTIIGTLDCLHLNIYVPKSAKPLPVMVWLFGGRYEIGFAGRFIYGPKYFMAHDVILVTVNYRLGPYGFLCTDTREVPGNQGLKDILMALRWIKKNIADFGGDYNNVTVFGESSGASAIDLYLTVDENLFDKAILMSGTSTRPLGVRKSDTTIPLKIASKLGFETKEPLEAVKFLSKLNPLAVIKAYLDLGIIFRPCVEKKFADLVQLIPDYPAKLPLRNLNKMPIMMGFCDSETMFRHYHKTSEDIRKKNIFKLYLETTFDLGNDVNELERIVTNFYLGDKVLDRSVIWDVIDFDSDFSFIHPIVSRIKDFRDKGGEVYQYMFKYSGKRNFVKKRAKISDGGACHADEIGYLFDISYDREPCLQDKMVIDRMTAIWTNFAKYGNPTPNTSPLLPLKWSPVTDNNMTCMVIDTELTTITKPLQQRMAFWDLFHKIYKHKLKIYKT